MPSDRLLAKLAAKNKQAPSDDEDIPLSRKYTSKPLSNASSLPVHCNVKRTSSGQDTHNAQQTSSVKRLKIAAPPQPLPGETSDKVNPVIVEIEPDARWTAGVSLPMQALDVFDLPADADAYINESPSELLNRTRRHFGRFAADFVHMTKLFGLNNFQESYQKLIEENTVLKNVQQESKTRIEQLQSEIASFEKQRQRWETDRLKLNTDNKRLSWDKSTLSSKVTELLSKLTALEGEHQQATNKINALELELNQVKSELIQADEESMNTLKEGYTACLDKFRAAGIDITGKTYQDYLNEITAKTTQTASNVLAPEIASNVAQAHLYTIIKVARDKDLMEQIGKDIYFDLVDHDKVRSFRIQKHISFNSFKEEVAKEFGVPVEFQRFWIWAKRQNHTYRPNRPLTQQEEAQSVGQLREVSNKNHNAELKLFLEIETGKDRLPISPPDKTKEDILLFFKLYDPTKEELRYVGRLFVKSTGRPIEILKKLNEMAGFDADEEIELFEEVKFEPCVMCERLDKRASFRLSQIEDGDIICFQKYPQPQNEEEYRYPDVPSYLEYVKNRQIVHFRSLEKPKEDDFCLELSKLHTYDDVVERVAQKLGLEDPSKIRLTPHNCYSQQPKPHPIKYRVAEHLLDMLVHYNQISDILYYEVLDIPLPELQCLKTLKVAFHHATKDEVVIHNIRLPKQSNVGDVLNEIKTKVELSHSNAELRLLEVFYHKIYKIFPLNEKIENINDQYWTLRAEEIPEEEKNLGPHDRLIHVYHFRKETTQMLVQNFGEPFFLVIHEGETLAVVKMRIQKKLQVPDEEFTKWKFAFVSLGRPEYLRDSDIVSSRFQRGDVYAAWEQYLGLGHSETIPKRAYNANQNRVHTYMRSVLKYTTRS